MINLEIKFSVFEVLKLLLFIFLKDQSIVKDQENIVKNFTVMFIKRLSKEIRRFTYYCHDLDMATFLNS